MDVENTMEFGSEEPDPSFLTDLHLFTPVCAHVCAGGHGFGGAALGALEDKREGGGRRPTSGESEDNWPKATAFPRGEQGRESSHTAVTRAKLRQSNETAGTRGTCTWEPEVPTRAHGGCPTSWPP